MQTPLASSISLAAEILAAPLGVQGDAVTSALGNPDLAKAECNKCGRHDCYLSLHLAQDIHTCGRSRSRSSSGDRNARNRSRSRSNSGDILRTDGMFAVLCEHCAPKGNGVQLRRQIRPEELLP